MQYKLDKAYGIKFTRVFYNIRTSLAYSDDRSSSYKDSVMDCIITSELGEEIQRNTSIFNNVLSFYYFTQSSSYKDPYVCFNKVNTDDIVVAGIVIPKHKGVILDFTANKVNVDLEVKDKKDGTIKEVSTDLYKVSVLIEIEIEKPLHQVFVPIKGFYFKHPVTGRKTRIQFSSCPELYLNKKEYPYAVEICRGLGFYSEDRPDLNVMEPVFLDIDGGILKNLDAVVFTACTEKKSTNWSSLGLPAEVGVEIGEEL